MHGQTVQVGLRADTPLMTIYQIRKFPKYGRKVKRKRRKAMQVKIKKNHNKTEEAKKQKEPTKKKKY